jgi:hypothetical protein
MTEQRGTTVVVKKGVGFLKKVLDGGLSRVLLSIVIAAPVLLTLPSAIFYEELLRRSCLDVSSICLHGSFPWMCG